MKKTIRKVSAKKKKAVDGSTRLPKKKHARRATDAAATEASASSFVPLAANAHNVLDGMPTSSLLQKNLFQGHEKKSKKGKIKKGRPFSLSHCYDALNDDEKWRPREGVDEERNKRKRTIDLDDDEEESSSDGGKRSPTPNSVAYSKPNRPSGGKKDGKEPRCGDRGEEVGDRGEKGGGRGEEGGIEGEEIGHGGAH
ncbi:tyrosine n-monooxygenase [Hordeum vulgare]|nr:tyrosine n-monooxygenase [Hordeum vulgare]